MILAAELTGAFLAGGVSTILFAGWLARRKMRELFGPLAKAQRAS